MHPARRSAREVVRPRMRRCRQTFRQTRRLLQASRCQGPTRCQYRAPGARRQRRRAPPRALPPPLSTRTQSPRSRQLRKARRFRLVLRPVPDPHPEGRRGRMCRPYLVCPLALNQSCRIRSTGSAWRRARLCRLRPAPPICLHGQARRLRLSRRPAPRRSVPRLHVSRRSWRGRHPRQLQIGRAHV